MPGQPSRLPDYLPLIEASRKALELTNPGPSARYVIITDRATAPALELDFELSVPSVPVDTPLLAKLLRSQALFAAECKADLLCLPDVDCFANRDLTDATPEDVGLAITHRGVKFQHRVNNIAYIRDMDLGTWFLSRAATILESWPVEAQEWWGDQEAWFCAASRSVNGLGMQLWEMFAKEVGNEIFVATPRSDRHVHIYPCETHNCFLADDGAMRPKHWDAYFCHLKGERKRHVEKFMAERFGLAQSPNMPTTPNPAGTRPA